MNIKECRVQNFANLSMFMSERFLEKVLKIYPKIADEFLIEKAILQISTFSLIHSDSTG